MFCLLERHKENVKTRCSKSKEVGVPVPYFQILRRNKSVEKKKEENQSQTPGARELDSSVCGVTRKTVGTTLFNNVAGLKLPRLPSEVRATFTCAVACSGEGEELTCQGPGFLNATVSISGSTAGVHIERRCLTATSLSAQVPPATNWTRCYYTRLSVTAEGD